MQLQHIPSPLVPVVGWEERVPKPELCAQYYNIDTFGAAVHSPASFFGLLTLIIGIAAKRLGLVKTLF